MNGDNNFTDQIWKILLDIRNDGTISFNVPEEQVKLKVHQLLYMDEESDETPPSNHSSITPPSNRSSISPPIITSPTNRSPLSPLSYNPHVTPPTNHSPLVGPVSSVKYRVIQDVSDRRKTVYQFRAIDFDDEFSDSDQEYQPHNNENNPEPHLLINDYQDDKPHPVIYDYQDDKPHPVINDYYQDDKPHPVINDYQDDKPHPVINDNDNYYLGTPPIRMMTTPSPVSSPVKLTTPSPIKLTTPSPIKLTTPSPIKLTTPSLKTSPAEEPRLLVISDEDCDDENLTKLFKSLRVQSEKKQQKFNRTQVTKKCLSKFIVDSSDSEQEVYDDDVICVSDKPQQYYTPVNHVKTRPQTTALTTPSANKAVNRNRVQMIKELFELYNKEVFDNKLPQDMDIIWNKRLRTTAAYCRYMGTFECRTASIEMSIKVCDTYHRIKNTLIHELCHAATWIIDGVRKAGHGPLWKAWGQKANSKFSELVPISRCHSYEISYKYIYQCTRCDFKCGRHSKSVKLDTARCPHCFSTLELFY